MSAETTISGALLEREGELRRLRRVISAAAGGDGSVTVIAAPAGLGKTKLLEAAVEDAAAAGLRPLVAYGSELEREFAFGIARQVLEPAVVPASDRERRQLLAGAARHAATVLELEPEGDHEGDLHSTLHGLYWLLANLSAESPLLVAIDDLQWADEPSLRWLARVAPRLEGLPIAVVAALRVEEAGEGPASSEGRRAAIDAIRDHVGLLRLAPAPLSEAGVGMLLERELGRESEPAFSAACRAHTGGNPFLLSELIAELVETGIAPTARNAGELARTVPDRVGEAIQRHLARVSRDAQALAAALAILEEGGDLPLAAELAGVELDHATRAAAELIEARILADSSPPRFRHPLLRAAVEASVSAPERASQHSRAARLLAERGAPPARIAAHLLSGTPGAGDPWVVEQLCAAARSARSQGVPEQAAVLLRRALAEPPPAPMRGELLRELGAAELVSGGAEASETLAAALARATGAAARAEIARGLGLAHYLGGRHEAAVDILMAMIDEVADAPELREKWLALEALVALAGRYDLRTETRVRGRVSRLAGELAGATSGERLVQAVAAGQSPGVTASDLFRTARLEEAALGAWPALDPTDGVGTVAMYLHAGHPDSAAALVERMLARSRGAGSHLRYAMALGARGLVGLDTGELRAAEADLEEAIAAMVEVDADRLAAAATGFYVQALGRRGRLKDANELLSERGLDGELPEQMVFNPFLFCRGELRLAQRRFEAAEEDFRALGRRHERWVMTRPSPPWRSACALALIGQGKAEPARALAAAELELVRAWDTPKAIAYTTRALALATAGGEAIDGLAKAVRLLEETPWRFDRARARLDLGSALRRAGRRRDGREALALAMDEAHTCGAEALAERAADELRASGARPRRRAISGLDALTPSERRVAELASAGRTNREIAQELFVTLATVETHLTRVYRKLDLDGRAGLAGALAS